MRHQSAKIVNKRYARAEINSDLRVASTAGITTDSTRAQLEVRLKPCIKRRSLNSTTF